MGWGMIVDTNSNTLGHAAALKARGITAVGRYYATKPTPKRLQPAEAQDLSREGLDIFAIFEDAGDPTLSVASGRTQAATALQQATAVGQPKGSAIYFALEHLPSGYTHNDLPGIRLYAQGLREVVGQDYRLGLYSCGVVLAAMLDEGRCDLAWLSASRGFEGSQAFYESRRWALAQDPHVDQVWNGLSIDVDEANGDFGAFRVVVPVASGS